MIKRYWVLVSLGWCSMVLAQTAPVSVAPTEYVYTTTTTSTSDNTNTSTNTNNNNSTRMLSCRFFYSNNFLTSSFHFCFTHLKVFLF